MKALKFTVLQPSFTINRLEPGAAIPKAVFASPFYSISQTEDELSIVAPETIRIETGKSDRGWRALKVEGPLDFALTGILAQIATTLDREGISIFAISTYDTDYILVKTENLQRAKTALATAGHTIKIIKEEDSLEQGYDLLLEKQIPLIKNIFVAKINLPTLACLRSDPALAAVAGSLYVYLPEPIRLVINRDIFIQFCVNNQDKILPETPQPTIKTITSK